MSRSRKLEGWVPSFDADGCGLDTLAVRAGQSRSLEMEHSEAIYPTSSFVFNNAAEAAARFSGEIPGNIYSRFTNPTVRMFEERMAALEGAPRAVATATGMAAILSIAMALLRQGDHVVCSRGVFGTTTVLFEKYLGKFGIACTFVALSDLGAWQRAVTPATRLFFLETPSNPISEVADIAAIADIAHRAGAKLVVDNCFCTPILQRPFQFGADIVMHSATKYIDGQGRCMGGVVLGNEADMNEVFGFLRSAGPALSPFNAWVLLKGLETLPLRMRAHSENALVLARWLHEQPGVESVLYAGLESHPQHALAARQQSAFSGVLSFRVKGGRKEAWDVIDATRIFSITANLGDVKSTITHPATTTHGRISADDKRLGGITENLIRLSVGLENLSDLQEDLSRGLAALR